MSKSTRGDPKTSLRFHTGDEVRLLLSSESLQMATSVGQAEKPRCLCLRLRPASPSGASWQAPVRSWQARDMLYIIVGIYCSAVPQRYSSVKNSNFCHSLLCVDGVSGVIFDPDNWPGISQSPLVLVNSGCLPYIYIFLNSSVHPIQWNPEVVLWHKTAK